MPAYKTMRITGGTLVRRRFLVPPMVDEGSVRPTPDRVREAVFSMLQEDIFGAKVLDLFAGSGAHGFEALSRGAESVLFIEKDQRVALIIKENIAALDVAKKCSVVVQDALSFVEAKSANLYDIIFVDPPYTITLSEDFFVALERHLAREGVVIFRCFKKDQPAINARFYIDRDRQYAGTRVFILRRALTS